MFCEYERFYFQVKEQNTEEDGEACVRGCVCEKLAQKSLGTADPA